MSKFKNIEYFIDEPGLKLVKQTRWEWYDNIEDKWNPYEDTIQKILNNAAFSLKQNSVDFAMKSVNYTAQFDHVKWCQTNKATKYSRPIRYCIKCSKLDSDDTDDEEDNLYDWVCWERQADDGVKWMCYSPTSVDEIELHYQKYSHQLNNNSLFKYSPKAGVHYTIDFKRMEQINDQTGYKRRVKRQTTTVIKDTTNMVKAEKVDAADESETGKRTLRKRTSVNYSDSGSGKATAGAETKPETKKSTLKKKKSSADNEENEENVVTSKRKLVQDEAKSDAASIKEEEEDKPTSSKSDKGRKKVKKDEEDDEEEEVKPTAKSGRKSGKKASKEVKEEPAEIIKSYKFSGDIPLDEVFVQKNGSNYQIYKEGQDIYDCMLNQTNIQFNNNKYYLIQLIEQVGSANYLVWMRWGRVGKPGQNSLDRCNSNLLQAKNIFEKKFSDKTGNLWSERDCFVKYDGKYDLVHKDYDAMKGDEEDVKQEEMESEDGTSQSGESGVVKVKKEKEAPPECKLDLRIQNLVELVCNVTEMEATLKEMKYDAKKAPLGKLSKNQINAGYAALTVLEDLIKNKMSGKDIVRASNDFYTRIPHDFGMRAPPLINTLPQIKEKLKLLEVLGDIEVAVKILSKKSEILRNPIDMHYEQLDCILTPLNGTHSTYKLIEQYLHRTHAITHSNYELKLLEVFEACKPAETARFRDLGNRMLLWHGSRLTNWAGILMQGLRIAPPEAPSTGYMFGKGCYFADSSSKSANYCYTSQNKNIGLLSLSEVSLGVWNEKFQADYNADQLPSGKHSTKGVGKNEPDSSQFVTMEDGCIVPCGKLRPSKRTENLALLYNEYIVYKTDQVKLRYLVKVEFEYV